MQSAALLRRSQPRRPVSQDCVRLPPIGCPFTPKQRWTAVQAAKQQIKRHHTTDGIFPPIHQSSKVYFALICARIHVKHTCAYGSNPPAETRRKLAPFSPAPHTKILSNLIASTPVSIVPPRERLLEQTPFRTLSERVFRTVLRLLAPSGRLPTPATRKIASMRSGALQWRHLLVAAAVAGGVVVASLSTPAPEHFAFAPGMFSVVSVTVSPSGQRSDSLTLMATASMPRGELLWASVSRSLFLPSRRCSFLRLYRAPRGRRADFRHPDSLRAMHTPHACRIRDAAAAQRLKMR